VCDLETSRIGAPYIYIYDISSLRVNDLTLILLTWRIRWAPINASKQQMEFNSAFKGLNAELNPICHLLALLLAHLILHVSRIRVKTKHRTNTRLQALLECSVKWKDVEVHHPACLSLFAYLAPLTQHPPTVYRVCGFAVLSPRKLKVTISLQRHWRCLQ